LALKLNGQHTSAVKDVLNVRFGSQYKSMQVFGLMICT